MQPTAVWWGVPDPMNLQPWEEQDEPLASDFHHDEQDYFFYALRSMLNPEGHYVTRDRWIRLSPHNHRRVLPDILIALDLQERQWGVNEYVPWEVGKPPDLVAEFLSPSSAKADQDDKFTTYAQLGVPEYFIFDPDGTFGVARVRGWRLRGSTWVPLPRAAGDAVDSVAVPVRFAFVDDRIVVIDPRTGLPALTYDQMKEVAHREEMARIRAEELARQEEVSRIRAEDVARLEREARLAAVEAHLRAAAEIARLRAELERRNKAG